MPLGLVFLAGPLIDAGHHVELLDNDVLGLEPEALAQRIRDGGFELVMLGHTGSTAAHPIAMATADAIAEACPEITVAYGGPYPTYCSEAVLERNASIDIVVRGEGEAAAVELANALVRNQPLSQVAGLTLRHDDGSAYKTPNRKPIEDLDAHRPGWEVVDWDAYRLFGFGRSAGMQFARGCPLRCTYCGQWGFWKKWRHRTPAAFVAELAKLRHEHDVRIVWLADENFGADRDLAQDVLQRIIDADLGLSLNLNMTAADVARDADLMPLYKRAGVDNIVMGLESLDDATVEGVRKNNPMQTSIDAVAALRRAGIVSLVNIIYGLEDERLTTLGRTFARMLELDADVLNACYITPHSWTQQGRQTSPREVIQSDLARYTYRNQVIATPRMGPRALFFGVKLSEALYHVRPRALWRLVTGRDRRWAKVMRAYVAVGARVVLSEIAEFITRTRFVAPGSLKAIPGYPATPGTRAPSLRVLTESADRPRGDGQSSTPPPETSQPVLAPPTT